MKPSSAQAAIDALTAQGVRHIVLMTHHGFKADRALAARLTGVDVIIGGDSHTLLGDFKALGLPAEGRYPTEARNASGEPVCIGQAWEYGKAFGLMNVQFDAQGRVSQCSGQASLVIGEPLQAQGRRRRLAGAAGRRGRRAEGPAGGQPGGAGGRARSGGGADAGRLRQPGRPPRRPASSAPPASRCAWCACPASGPTRAPAPGCETASSLARGSDVAQVVAEAFLRGSPARRLRAAERRRRAHARAGRHAEHEHRLHRAALHQRAGGAGPDRRRGAGRAGRRRGQPPGPRASPTARTPTRPACAGTWT